MPTRKPIVATLLNLILPGAGLWYLGHSGWGLLNFAAAASLVAGAFFALPADFTDGHFHYVFLAVWVGSAGLAHAVAVNRIDRS